MKSTVGQAFIWFKTQVEIQHGFKIKILQSDYKEEFQALTSFLKASSIFHHTSCSHPYHHNE